MRITAWERYPKALALSISTVFEGLGFRALGCRGLSLNYSRFLWVGLGFRVEGLGSRVSSFGFAGLGPKL